MFEPAIARLPGAAAGTVTISEDSYTVFSVTSAGMDAGSRVVDLTLPLALAGIPIFFITTYYCDFILVPAKDRDAVDQALVDRGFELSEDHSSLRSPAGGLVHRTRSITPSRTPGGGGGHAPPSPPPSEAGELQDGTFELLKRRNVVPRVEPGLRLVQCSGREKSAAAAAAEYENLLLHQQQQQRQQTRPSIRRSQTAGDTPGERRPRSWVDRVDTRLYAGLVSALASRPRFLSVTLAQGDPPSLLLDRSLLGAFFGDSLVGDTDGELVPVFLDLVNLSFEATGIVSGVAGKLVEEMQGWDGGVQLSYLSTARAGAVILSSERSARALEILGPLLSKE